jgi:hypothetical protein
MRTRVFAVAVLMITLRVAPAGAATQATTDDLDSLQPGSAVLQRRALCRHAVALHADVAEGEVRCP